MMEERNMIPALRFPYFEEEWDEQPFKNLVKINQGLQIPISERLLVNEPGTHFYITNEFLRSDSDKKYYIKNATDSVICGEDDILMTRTGNTGKVVTDVAGAFHNNFFKISYPKCISKIFLVNYLNLPQTQNYILRLAGTSTIPDLNHSDFYKINLNFPSLPEQQKIASFLTAVDDKITQLSKKAELLEQYKKGVMQKIFPSASSGAPKLRFKIKNQAGELVEPPDWEEMKLGEVGQTYNGLSGKSADDFGSGSPYIQYKQIFDSSKIELSKCNFVKITPNERQNLIKYGDAFFTTSSETPYEVGTASVLLDHIDNAYLNSFCFGYRPCDLAVLLPEFMRYLFRNQLFRKKIIKLAQGSTRYNMSKKEFEKISMLLPCLEEQQKIASFLNSIDRKIEQVNIQLEKAKTWKKGLLQKMFV